MWSERSDALALLFNEAFITLFCTGFVEVELNALSTVTLVAPVAIPSNFFLSAAE